MFLSANVAAPVGLVVYPYELTTVYTKVVYPCSPTDDDPTFTLPKILTPLSIQVTSLCVCQECHADLSKVNKKSSHYRTTLVLSLLLLVLHAVDSLL